MKVCTKCKVEKAESGFSKDRARKDGLARHCKKCSREAQRIWYQKRKLKDPLEKAKEQAKEKELRDGKMRVCTRCNVIKDEGEFGKDKHGKNGLRSGCKRCMSIEQTIRFKKSYVRKRATSLHGKICPECKEDLPLTFFNKSSAKRLGVYSYCKKCDSLRRKEPGFKEKEYVTTRKWLEKNREHVIMRERKWVNENRARYNELARLSATKSRESLGDGYIKKILRAKGFSTIQLKNNQDIINTQKAIVQYKRIKNEKNRKECQGNV